MQLSRGSGKNDGLVSYGIVLSLLLCLVNGVWFARGRTLEGRIASGFLWTLGGLIVNAAVAFAGCLVVSGP